MFLQAKIFVEISNHHVFRYTKDYNVDMYNKSHSGKLGIFTYILTYSGIFKHIQAYSEPCVTLPVYDDAFYKVITKIVKGYNYFCKS